MKLTLMSVKAIPVVGAMVLTRLDIMTVNVRKDSWELIVKLTLMNVTCTSKC